MLGWLKRCMGVLPDLCGKELFQARVLEARDHTSSVTRVVTSHKSPNVPAEKVDSEMTLMH
jgi:hypothetical protein